MKMCSFCGNTESKTRIIIEGAKANICEKCYEICGENFEELKSSLIENMDLVKKPYEIKELLDEFVIGQDEAKKILSVAVYNHYKRVNVKTKVDIQKTNIMLIGPTGSGKTYLMQILAKILDVPLVIVDATTFTEKGYVGDDVESILQKLYVQADYDLERAEKGIVYIDEVDKIVSRTGGNHQSLDVNGTGVQQALLKIIEDSEIPLQVKGELGLGKKEVIMNTKNILFVCGGAFVGLDKVIEKRRKKKKQAIGFAFSSVNTQEKEESVIDSETITQSDIIEYGFLPEFVGRVPVIATLNKLTKKELRDILTKPKNAIIKQYKELFRIDGVRVNFHKDALDYIVEEAVKKDVGARGLKGVIEKQMYNLMFELPRYEKLKKFTITKSVLQNNEININEKLDGDEKIGVLNK